MTRAASSRQEVQSQLVVDLSRFHCSNDLSNICIAPQRLVEPNMAHSVLKLLDCWTWTLLDPDGVSYLCLVRGQS